MQHDNYRDAQRMGQAPIDFRASLWPSRIPRDHVGLVTLRDGRQVFWTGRMAIGLHFKAPVLKFRIKLKPRSALLSPASLRRREAA
jgi:hypothetical protein